MHCKRSLAQYANQAWVSDITYVRTYEGFLYVATVLDLFSRRIVGWAMDKHWGIVTDRHPHAVVGVELGRAVFQCRSEIG